MFPPTSTDVGVRESCMCSDAIDFLTRKGFLKTADGRNFELKENQHQSRLFA